MTMCNQVTVIVRPKGGREMAYNFKIRRLFFSFLFAFLDRDFLQLWGSISTENNKNNNNNGNIGETKNVLHQWHCVIRMVFFFGLPYLIIG